ncbi:hypothetical protein PILCRDRAFT_9870 [Piloderma croceum F 1598]|uniref:Uncharacterized protein n=1 Tax=Piloderma croceum (strain F 1598) TaxID=765440 RepID=A0A0C3F5J8_PILCF|nr:hypothetical protein PILCRDRAFT_9870 [Piloderma croceum F 1598]
MTDLYEQCSQDILAHCSRQEELARHVEDLVTELHKGHRALEAKELALQSALNDLVRTQLLLTQRESDLGAVQSSLQGIDSKSKRLGETHTTAGFSLQLEVDRLKRDLERLEDNLSRARKEIDDKETKNREREGAIDKLHAENRNLASQLAAQTQVRLNVADKLDGVQGQLRSAESEVATFRGRVNELEQRLSKDQRSLLSAESQYRDQLTERNTLLLTIYQYMDKILGVDKTPKKGGQVETKPFTNFSVFHDNLITRLKALSQIQLDFDKRCKEAEARFTENVKTYVETKAGWRRKFSAKEGELEAIKATNTDTAAQLASQKCPGQNDSMENQLVAAEEKMTAMNQKNANADSKWEARVKEYESHLKAAEERVKRERQGSKERVAE